MRQRTTATPNRGPNRERRRAMRRGLVVAVDAALAAGVGGVGALLATGPAWAATATGPLTGTRAPLPPNAGANGSASLGSEQCPVTGACIAVGGYQDATGNDWGLIDTLSDGTWSAVTAPEPAGAGTGTHQSAALLALSCSSASACVAVGDYRDATGHEWGLIETFSGASWVPSSSAAPAGTSLSHVTCASAGHCVAIGDSGPTAIIATDTSGSWSVANAPTPQTASLAQLSALSCSSATSCVAVGGYSYKNSTTTMISSGLIDTLSGGQWASTDAPLPAGGKTPALTATTCAVGSSCVATGFYEDATGHQDSLIETRAGGTWTAATVPEPADAGSGATQSAALNAVSCTADHCTAVGTYGTTGGQEAGFLVGIGGGSSVATAALPAGTGSNPNLLTVACAAGGCQAAGTYADTAGTTQGLLEGIAAPTVTSLTPQSGAPAGGTPVVIDGTGFLPGATVEFGTQPAASVTYDSPTELEAVAPAGSGIVDVTVSTVGGTSATGPLDRFVYGLSGGYWTAASDGGVFAFGTAPFEGSAGGSHLAAPAVGMAATPDGRGYWLVGADGGIFAFGDAAYEGSLPADGVHVGNVVGMAATADGGGYWLVGADGGIFAFGDAAYEGSMAGHPLGGPMVGIAS